MQKAETSDPCRRPPARSNEENLEGSGRATAIVAPEYLRRVFASHRRKPNRAIIEANDV